MTGRIETSINGLYRILKAGLQKNSSILASRNPGTVKNIQINYYKS